MGDRPCSRGRNLDVCYFLWNINCSLLPCLTETGIGSRRTPTGLLRLWQGVGRETGVGGDIRAHHREQPGQSSNILCRAEWKWEDTPFECCFFLHPLSLFLCWGGIRTNLANLWSFRVAVFCIFFLLSPQLSQFLWHIFCQFCLLALLKAHYISCRDNIWKAL